MNLLTFLATATETPAEAVNAAAEALVPDEPLGLDDPLFWVAAVGLVVGLPLLLIAVGELGGRLRLARHPLAEPVKNLGRLVLPLAGLWLLLRVIMHWPADHWLVRVVATLVLIALVWFVLSLVNAVLFDDRKEGGLARQVPKLLRDLARTLLVAVAGAVILSAIWDVNLAGLLTALGVGSIVIGLALQDTLGNVFAGITLVAERPVRVNDYVKIGTHIAGRVVDINWRSIHVRTKFKELLVVPNNVVAKEIFLNYSLPSEVHAEPVFIDFTYADPPNHVMRVLYQTALQTPGVLTEPPPIVECYSYAESGITYRVRLHVDGYMNAKPTRSRYHANVWYAARRHGIGFPFPTRTVHLHKEQDLTDDQTIDRQERDLARRLGKLPAFKDVDPTALKKACDGAKLLYFASGEPILRVGESPVRLHFIVRGRVRLTAPDALGVERPLSELDRGDFFGDIALLSKAPSAVAATAMDDCELVSFRTDRIRRLLRDESGMARRMDEVIYKRRTEIAMLKEQQG